jgi:CRISPR-associated protein Cas1
MKKTKYLFNPGQLSRKDNTLKFTPVDTLKKPQYLPIEGIETLFVFGSLDVNSALLNFLGKNRVSVHFFDYYEHYTGSFMPKEFLLAGKVQVAQTQNYLRQKRRMHIAQQLIEGASWNMLKNLKYYHTRGKPLELQIERINKYRKELVNTTAVNELMGLEGNCRQTYYSAFDTIINGEFTMNGRSKQPPQNEINALISFGNMMCYTLCLDMIYHTQLNPTISFLHEPGTRRYSLALDLAEIFKPLLVDRVIFKLLNKRQLQGKHFNKELNKCLLNDSGKKIFIQAYEERLKETIHHRKLDRKVSYKRLVWLECHKVVKYILKDKEAYEPFKMWW